MRSPLAKLIAAIACLSPLAQADVPLNFAEGIIGGFVPPAAQGPGWDVAAGVTCVPVYTTPAGNPLAQVTFEYGSFPDLDVRIFFATETVVSWMKAHGAFDNAPPEIDPTNPDWDHPYWIGIATFVLIHESLHSEHACGPASGANADCIHLAIAIGTAQATCELIGQLKGCLDDPECPPFPSDENGDLEDDDDVQDMIDGLCAAHGAAQSRHNTEEGQQTALNCVCSGNASPGATPNCPTIEVPSRVGCGSTPDGSGDWPIENCDNC